MKRKLKRIVLLLALAAGALSLSSCYYYGEPAYCPPAPRVHCPPPPPVYCPPPPCGPRYGGYHDGYRGGYRGGYRRGGCW